MGVYKEMKEKGWLNFSDTYRAAQSGVYGKMYQLMNTYNPVTGTFALEHTDTAMNDYLQEAEYRNTDWFDALFSNSVMHNHSFIRYGKSFFLCLFKCYGRSGMV